MCVLSVQGCRLNTDSLVQCGYEVRFTNVKAYVLMEATAYTATRMLLVSLNSFRIVKRVNTIVTVYKQSSQGLTFES